MRHNLHEELADAMGLHPDSIQLDDPLAVAYRAIADERRRWLNWLADIGYGQDFSHDDDPPCTARELAEVLNERQPLDADATPGYTTGVDLWLWTLAESTGYGRDAAT